MVTSTFQYPSVSDLLRSILNFFRLTGGLDAQAKQAHYEGKKPQQDQTKEDPHNLQGESLIHEYPNQSYE